MTLRVVFAGTPDFAVPSLRAAASRAEVVAVYTQPDRPSGRGQHTAFSPVKVQALALGLPVFQPQDFRATRERDTLRALRPDVMIVVAYGLILSPSVLAIPRYGGWNVHASLLPRWRGAAPIQRAIEAGDARTGVCLMQMEKGLDTGPVMLRLETEIADSDTGGSLHQRLALLGAELVEDGLKLLRAGVRPVPVPQATEGVTYARKLEKTEAVLDWAQSASALVDKARAFHPWPVCEAQVAGERLRVHSALALPLQHRSAPGTVLSATKSGLDIACGEGALRLLTVQRDGGKPVAIGDYLNARPNLRGV